MHAMDRVDPDAFFLNSVAHSAHTWVISTEVESVDDERSRFDRPLPWTRVSSFTAAYFETTADCLSVLCSSGLACARILDIVEYMSNPIKTSQSLASDIGRMQRESGMVMATVASLADDEIIKPSKCEGWTRAHVITHLARGADAMRNLATWAVTGVETPAYESREQRDADIEVGAKRSAIELVADLERANARLLDAFQALKEGVRVDTLPTLFSGEINAFSLPARRTTELIVHHDDLDTTWEWHEADTDSILDAIEVCVRRLQVNPDSPGLRIIAGEGDEWTVGDGSYRIEGYYDELLPFLARQQVEEGLQYKGELPKLPPW